MGSVLQNNSKCVATFATFFFPHTSYRLFLSRYVISVLLEYETNMKQNVALWYLIVASMKPKWGGGTVIFVTITVV